MTVQPEGPGLTGATLLDALRAALTRYVILPSDDATTGVVLWIAASHAQPAWAHAPRLVIRAPEKRCGKSRLLDVVEATCHRPLITVNATSAAIYRSINEDPPTLLVDEADTIFTAGKAGEGNEDLRGLLNAGHQRNRPAIRWDHVNRQLDECPTFAMAALAGIGAMPDTIEDRAVVIHMRRRAPGETVAPYRHRRDRPALRDLAADLEAWLRPGLAVLEKAEPAMPVEDRAADTWEPLIAVADHAAGPWPDLARRAVLALTSNPGDADTTSLRTRLLIDCRTAMTGLDAIPTARLLHALNTDPEAPWSESGPAGLTSHRLGAMLREYGIQSANHRFPDSQAKGYLRAAFTDAWQRYCPPEPTPPDEAPPDVEPGRIAALVRIDPSHRNQASRADLRRDAWDGWDGTPDEPFDHGHTAATA
ncbi:DUF3631 domain-containing protein [Pseudofrankia sp. DC12]|uniref:DUF3631 domain-containing protein n=1 Tax=Pseudofrankia sp. DC12 TaxID=683315 RepID=UPI000AEE91C6|nr:DUF3631 domain-containing protein [Pseudofrankia sp. DC12]